MTQKEKKVLLDELEKALYQSFSYRKRNIAEVVIMQTSFHASSLENVCRKLGLNREVDVTIEYVNKLVYEK